MSHTTDIEDTEFMGAVKARYAVVDIDSYEEGGENIGPNDIGLNRFQVVQAFVRDGSGYLAEYDEEGENLLIRQNGDSDTDTGGEGGDGPFPEVDAGTEVSVRFVGYGK